uniref:myelin-associated glycoprotein-like n=1 Tax=Pristiophorus japonicus TaxID=55135 RepID=UPI00398F71DB
MIKKSYLLLSLLQAVMSQEWNCITPRDVRAQEGLCVQIPCNYSYPLRLANQPRVGIWYYNEENTLSSVAFHSKNRNRELPRFRHRTRLSGDLKDGDCSLIINNITQEDAGPYYFRIEFANNNRYNYYPVTRLRVSDFTDNPTIFPAGIIAGKRVDISCTYNTTCNGTTPVLTWVNATDIPGSVSNSVTQHGDTLTYTSVLTLIPSLKHQGQSLTCRVRYPSVSSEQSLTLTVQYAPRNLSITSLDMINDSSISIKEGNYTVILCSVESFPASNLTWRHLGVTRNRTSYNNELWLEFAHVTYRVAGDYQCVAENEHGAVERIITITVEYAPRNLSITSLDMINDSSISIKEGNYTVILCSVESFPASNLTWRHLGVTRNRTSYNNELWLEFAHVTYRVAGDYQCVTENEHGAVEKAITITVEHPPKETTVTISGATGGIRVGNNITLTCCSKSVPPASSYAWFRIDGNRITQLNTSAQSVYIGHVTRESDASFYCTARNPLGNGTSAIVHLNVEYKPEISRESECTRRAEGVTCVCAARSNPPGDLRWHLPFANVSGNQTHNGFAARQISDGQLVTGSLTLRGGKGEEEMTVICSVTNQHGEAMFKVYLWVKGRDFSKWEVGMLAAGIMLSVELAGFLIFKCVRKRKAATEERASATSDIAMTHSPLSAKHQDPQSAVVVDPRNTTSAIASEPKTPAPQDLSEGPAVGDAGHGQPAMHEDLLYANINFLMLPSGDGTVHRGEDTEYAQIRLQ